MKDTGNENKETPAGGRWPWTIHSWDDFKHALSTMNPRSKLFKIIKDEMVKRGNWRPAPRGPFKNKQ